MINRIDWGAGRTLHGNGPGYLLTTPDQTLDLRTGAPEIVDPGLRDRLHGFNALPSNSPIYQAAAHLAHLARMHGVLWDQEKERERQMSAEILINLLTRAVLDKEHKLGCHIGEISTILRVANRCSLCGSRSRTSLASCPTSLPNFSFAAIQP